MPQSTAAISSVASRTSTPQAEAYRQGNRRGEHTRNYQACENCQKRKVKCNLGPVDNPGIPF